MLWRAGNRRNLPLAGVLGTLAAANVVFHLAVLGIVDMSPVRALYAALALIVVIECVIAGRVIPAFTANATPGLTITARPRLTQAALATVVAALGLWVLGAPARAHRRRTRRRRRAATGAAMALASVRDPRPADPVDPAPVPRVAARSASCCSRRATGHGAMSAGVHALAVGATGGLIIGMLTRTARGHTGRPLQVSRLEVAAYVLVLGAAVCRAILPLVAPQLFLHLVAGAATAWSAAFLIYLVIYTPWLTTTRLDGKDG